MDKLNILDCTFRDGGYYNNWNFSNKLVSDYVKKINKSNIDIVEIGFRFFKKNLNFGDFAYSDDKIIKKFKFKKNIKIAIMINASELLNNKNYKKFFIKKKNTKVEIIRIAAHISEIKNIKSHIIYLYNLGYKVILNIMQISMIKKKDILKLINSINYKNYLHCLYFADSLGSLDPNQIKEIFIESKKKINIPLGIHAHDNKGYALSNTLTAKNYGATWLDSTILGMGRGAGNTQTEILVSEIKKYGYLKYNANPLFELSTNYFNILKNKYKWGQSAYYYICAIKNIHPSYLQTILNDKNISSRKVLKILDRLGKIDSSSYDKEFLNSLIRNTSNTQSFLKNWCANNEVLIIGNGPNLKKNIISIKKFIKEKKIKVLSLNINKYINSKFISYYVASYLDRILIDLTKYKSLKKSLIIPKYIYEKIVPKNKFNKRVKFFDIKKTVDKFIAKNNYCYIPNNLAFSYALAIALIGKAKKIHLAGFDGYEDLNDIRNKEMMNTIKIYQRNKENPPIFFITDSLYTA